FGFSHKSAGGHSRIRCGRQAQTAITNRQPKIIESNWNVEQPCRPKLPARPAPHAHRYATEFSEKKKRCANKEGSQNNRDGFAIEKGEPKQRLRTQKLRDCENSCDPQQRSERGDESKTSKRHRE